MWRLVTLVVTRLLIERTRLHMRPRVRMGRSSPLTVVVPDSLLWKESWGTRAFLSFSSRPAEPEWHQHAGVLATAGEHSSDDRGHLGGRSGSFARHGRIAASRLYMVGAELNSR